MGDGRKIEKLVHLENDWTDFDERKIFLKKYLDNMYTGAHQLSQAVSYSPGMIDKDGQIKLQFAKEKSNVSKLQIQYRHISPKV